MITIEEALYLVDNAIKPERLNSVQELILTQCWSGKTYQEIAEASGYDSDYVRVVGSRLWQLLSQVFEEKITKNNFRSILRQQIGKNRVKSQYRQKHYRVRDPLYSDPARFCTLCSTTSCRIFSLRRDRQAWSIN